MKTSYILFCLPALFTIFSCSQQPKHPQADLISQSAATAMTDKTIGVLADSIDANLSQLEKQSSLVYLQGEQSMYAERYSANGKAILYVEHRDNGLINSQTKKYYFKNDSLILVQENKKTNNDYTDTRIFLRNNIAFRKEQRKANAASVLQTKPYLSLKSIKDNTTKEEDYKQNIRTLDEAIAGNNQYEMLFDQFIDIPGENIIQLKSKAQNGYTASILVKEPDAFIDSLKSNSQSFRNEKLNFKWKVEDKEAVYVPVAAKVTSAKGLNK
ncbi:hypothetical protein SAMN05421820_105255 [Pedobacter steynii]|uniref:Uncharacterized protein n=1 Tax=Pedobacter steynii TaxID=430522 RepID=A0A1G9WSF2_9SPHI|nr:hypothetical protein [Pedobacter steynii]NQX40375.1 hypothetical protein [Pedobacter steynii]SDM87105.1 hypothetical protein SAMN05421820_105255 [Pedobacter steynii]